MLKIQQYCSVRHFIMHWQTINNYKLPIYKTIIHNIHSQSFIVETKSHYKTLILKLQHMAGHWVCFKPSTPLLGTSLTARALQHKVGLSPAAAWARQRWGVVLPPPTAARGVCGVEVAHGGANITGPSSFRSGTEVACSGTEVTLPHTMEDTRWRTELRCRYSPAPCRTAQAWPPRRRGREQIEQPERASQAKEPSTGPT